MKKEEYKVLRTQLKHNKMECNALESISFEFDCKNIFVSPTNYPWLLYSRIHIMQLKLNIFFHLISVK